MSLFEQTERANRERARPLAARMRPRSLSEFVGQRHFLDPAGLLTRLIQADRLGSLIFFGPPGCGKTTLAQLLAGETGRRFVELNAISHGVKELREVLRQARDELSAGEPAWLLFVDEIHRFNRSQQDVMLADVEEGVISLIGATTSNPYFAINGALLSRSRIFEFQPLSREELEMVVRRALSDRQRGLGHPDWTIDPEAIDLLSELSDGDARQALATLEIAAATAPPGQARITAEGIRASTLKRAWNYDPSGSEHYDCASALIKSIRGSDADAAIYWLARMLAGGEELRFLCRRLVILASEDIGNADPRALPLAVACFTACEQVGLPESKYMLAQTVTYLACAPKSNASTRAISAALEDVENRRIVPVPRALRSSGYRGAASLGHGLGYQYAHDAPEGVAAQEYLGVDRQYYQPVERGFESELASRMVQLRRMLQGEPGPDQTSTTGLGG
jgi:putative ATPase